MTDHQAIGVLVVVMGAIVLLWSQFGSPVRQHLARIESKLDEQASRLEKLVKALSSDNSPNLPSFKDVRGILKREDGEDES